MRRIVRSKTYVRSLQTLLEYGARSFGLRVAEEKLRRVDEAIDFIARHPAAKPVDPSLALHIYPVNRTPFVVLYDYDEQELRVHLIVHSRADISKINPGKIEW